MNMKLFAIGLLSALCVVPMAYANVQLAQNHRQVPAHTTITPQEGVDAKKPSKSAPKNTKEDTRSPEEEAEEGSDAPLHKSGPSVHSTRVALMTPIAAETSMGNE